MPNEHQELPNSPRTSSMSVSATSALASSSRVCTLSPRVCTSPAQCTQSMRFRFHNQHAALQCIAAHVSCKICESKDTGCSPAITTCMESCLCKQAAPSCTMQCWGDAKLRISVSTMQKKFMHSHDEPRMFVQQHNGRALLTRLQLPAK